MDSTNDTNTSNWNWGGVESLLPPQSNYSHLSACHLPQMPLQVLVVGPLKHKNGTQKINTFKKTTSFT